MYAEVAVHAPPQGTFHYRVPPELADTLTPGHLVRVPFGASQTQGIVVALSETAPVPQTRDLGDVLDPQPVVTAHQLALARWLSETHLAPLFACLRLMLPPGYLRRADLLLEATGADGAAGLTSVQRQVLDLLRQRGPLRARQLDRALPGVRWRSALAALVERGWVSKQVVFESGPRPKHVRLVHLTAPPELIAASLSRLGHPSRQADVLDYLATSPDPLPALERVCAAVGCTPAPIKALEKRGWVYIAPRQVLVQATVPPEALEATLTELAAQAPQQAAALAALRSSEPRPMRALGFKPTIWRALEQRGLVRRLEEPRAVVLRLSAAAARQAALNLRGAARQLALLDYLQREARPVEASWAYAETGCTLQDLKALANLGLVMLHESEIWRDSLAGQTFEPSEPPTLAPDQERAWAVIANGIEQGGAGRVYLLHGVTGSGKTEIYLRALEAVLAQGRQGIVLVPEIALTPQTVRRFAGRFPGRVALLHSRLSAGERYDTWRRARAGRVDVVIGPRSALFMPLPRLGLIIVDEEHEDAYKQDLPIARPYYHAREAAVALARISNAVCILGSATPSLTSYYRAERGEYCLLALPQRVMSPGLPQVQVVDMRQELRAGNRSIFSRALQSALADALVRGEQAILFLNRRGTATFVLCRDCGYVLSCPRCDLPLTYHGPQARLVCHSCNFRTRQPERCPACHSRRIKYFGLGTERVEEVVRQTFPGARTLRWDRDTTRTRGAHDLLLRQFAEHHADILIGTQMIAKGLDLPSVTLVGVVSADTALGLPDPHAGERAFQLLTQVAGRAGRGERGGRVIFQTYNPDHYAIRAAAEHDYLRFYRQELAFRQEHGYPPFRRLARLVYENTDARKAEAAAEQLAERLRSELAKRRPPATDLIGPVPCYFARRHNRYRWQVLVRSPDPAALLRGLALPAGWRLDMDPVSTL
ncbi:MAG: primosomal protein N' [Chloroflexota bacterium]